MLHCVPGTLNIRALCGIHRAVMKTTAPDNKDNDSTLPSRYDPTVAERYWYPVWEKAGYFSPDHSRVNPEAKTYSIAIPPPNVTGALHLGHALTVTIEDMLIRWRRMQGLRTLWLPGTDHAGIATQMVVERQLKVAEGKSRHDIGREAFIERVWKWKERYGDRINTQQRVLGCSLDWSRDRFTMDENLSVSVREAFVRLFEDGLIYRAERLVNWCPRCHTALSDLEVNHDENVQGELWSFAYPLMPADQTADNKELVVATTRPETMLGDTGVAVHPEDPRYQHLIGKSVRHPLFGYAIPVVGDAELVDPDFGTGVVKVTPAHDFNDFATGKRHQLTLFNIFDENANVVQSPDVKGDIKNAINPTAWQVYAGLDRNEARKKVKADLRALGLERGTEAHTMSIGACDRCQTTVEPSLSLQWWVKTEPLAEPALAAVKTGATKIVPEGWTKTYYHWMENIQDWCVSRQLWWGHRIPAWYCLSCSPSKDEAHVFTSTAIVSRTTPTSCPDCSGTDLVQDNDVLDTWFSSGLWPFATLGWPDEDSADLTAFYPNTVMETGFDILFFWVARMMMMGCKFMGKPPFPIVYLHAMVRDKDGHKMSKTRGNVIDPLHLVNGCTAEEVAEQFKAEYPDGLPAFGADALRFTLAAMSGSGRDIKLNIDRIAGYRAFANKIWNAARFVLMRIGDEKPAPLHELKEGDLQPADRYILSRLAEAAEKTNQQLEDFRFADAASSVYQFFWSEFCDWYIELVKPRLFAEASDTDSHKQAASSTLVFVLDQALRLLHPMMPFITEEIWQRLPIDRGTVEPSCAADGKPGCDTIMLSLYPQADTLLGYRDEALEQEYSSVQNAIVGIRTVRAESNVPPSKEVDVVLLSNANDLRGILEKHTPEITKLARLGSLEIMVPGQYTRPSQAAVKVIEGLEVVVSLAGIIDFAKEVERLEKAIMKMAKERDKINAKLENENFVSRAPKEVVEKDRARSAELNVMLESLKESLGRAQTAAKG